MVFFYLKIFYFYDFFNFICRAGLPKLWVEVAKYNFGVTKQIGSTNQKKHFVRLYKKIKSKLVVKLFLVQFRDNACFKLSAIY